MGTLRALARLVGVGVLTAFFYPLVIVGRLVGWRSPRLRIGVQSFCFRNWSRAILRLLGGRVEVHGIAPEPPFLLVANHLGYLDILVLAAHLDAVFVAKAELASWPIVGRLCRGVGTIFVDRNARRDLPRVMAAIDRALAEGRGVVLFPEGTSTPGFEVAPFRPPLLEVAARAARPVSYAALSYRTGSAGPPAHLAISWWGDMDFGGHAWRLLRLEGLEARLQFGSETIQDADRKRLAERLRNSVEACFVPTAQAGPAKETA